MRPFDYCEPRNVEEAVAALAEGPGPTRALAGGTDLLVRLKRRVASVRRVVNLKRIPELRGIEEREDGALSMGPLVTIEEIARSDVVARRHPMLVEAASQMASPQIRTLATVGGNIANASPAADLAPPLLCLAAAVTAAGPRGERSIPLEEFFLGPGQTALAPDEIITRIAIPATRGRGAFIRFCPRAMDLAVVSVACFATDDEVRVALGAVAPTPIRVPPSPEEAAARARPIDDVRATARYRRALVPVLVLRALQRVIA